MNVVANHPVAVRSARPELVDVNTRRRGDGAWLETISGIMQLKPHQPVDQARPAFPPAHSEC